METITVSASIEYDVLIDNGIINKCGEMTAKVITPCKACIITDDNVKKYYLDIVEESYKNAGFDVISFSFPDGENSKNIKTISDIYEFLAENHLTRSDIIIALGGGIVGDTAGFAAATYLRGIKFIQIPTTFLAAIDSSVGGKTGVNLNAGKNLCGAFHQPSLVICDPECFKTMDKERYLDGTAEAVKYAVLKDEKIIDYIRNDIIKMVTECVKIKRDIVSHDEFDTGERQLLNLGHTLGHAIEKLSDFEITHGHAVAIGMVLISQAGEKSGITKPGTAEKIKSVLKEEGLPISCKYTAEELCDIALNDKKRTGGTITLVIPDMIGKCELRKVKVSELFDFVKGGIS